MGVRGFGSVLWVTRVCVIHVGSAPASAASQQREDRHHRADEEKCPIGTEMVFGPKYEMA